MGSSIISTLEKHTRLLLQLFDDDEWDDDSERLLEPNEEADLLKSTDVDEEFREENDMMAYLRVCSYECDKM
jgi:hypothetical protein